jgi:hypothetical protein
LRVAWGWRRPKRRLVKLFAGTKLFGAKIINAALGAGSTVSLGYELVDGTAGGAAAALIAATSTAAAARTESNSALLLVLAVFYITATIGGGPASGQLDAVILFEHRGTL